MTTLKSTWENFVFEYRNKEYGAYRLRKGYSAKMSLATFIVVSSFILVLVVSNIFKRKESAELINTQKPVKIIYYAELAPPPPIEKIYQPSRQVIDKQNIQKIVKYIAPKVTSAEVDETEDLPTMYEVKTNITGSENVEGTGNIVYEDVYEEPVKVETKPEEKVVYNFAQKQPEFPGGQGALLKFLHNNIKYPEIAQENGMQGTVIVQFTVNENGKLEDILVLRGFDQSCDEEAIRVIKNMPDWKAGEQNGKKVSVRFVIPIRFILN